MTTSYEHPGPPPRRPEPRDASLLSEGGRGLHIVDALASEWGAAPTGRGKSVWFWIDTATSGAPYEA